MVLIFIASGTAFCIFVVKNYNFLQLFQILEKLYHKTTTENSIFKPQGIIIKTT